MKPLLSTVLQRLKDLVQVPLYSGAFFLMLANLVNAFFGFVFWIVAARVYSAESVGMASAVISAGNLLIMVSGLGVSYGLLRFLPSSRSVTKLINSSFCLTGLISVATALIFILGLGLWSPALIFIRDSQFYMLAFLLLVLTTTLAGLIDQSLVAGRKSGFVLVRILLFNSLKIILLVLLGVSFHSLGIVAAWSISVTITVTIGIFWFLPVTYSGYRLFRSIKLKNTYEILPFSLKNYISDLFQLLPGFLLPILVINLLNAQSSAYFFMAWAISNILIVIPTAISISLIAEGSHNESSIQQNVRRSLMMVTVFLTPAVVLVFIFADKVLLLFGNSYAINATSLLRWLVIATVPAAINNIFFAVKRIQKDLMPVILLAFMGSAITIAFSYLLLQVSGLFGVGIAWLLGQGFISFWIFIKMFKIRLLRKSGKYST